MISPPPGSLPLFMGRMIRSQYTKDSQVYDVTHYVEGARMPCDFTPIFLFLEVPPLLNRNAGWRLWHYCCTAYLHTRSMILCDMHTCLYLSHNDLATSCKAQVQGGGIQSTSPRRYRVPQGNTAIKTGFASHYTLYVSSFYLPLVRGRKSLV